NSAELVCSGSHRPPTTLQRLLRRPSDAFYQLPPHLPCDHSAHNEESDRDSEREPNCLPCTGDRFSEYGVPGEKTEPERRTNQEDHQGQSPPKIEIAKRLAESWVGEAPRTHRKCRGRDARRPSGPSEPSPAERGRP